MTDWVQIVVLALIQGITEFLPVSSSAHLILPAQLWGWIDQGLLFDVAVHAGSLCAVLWYFRDTMIHLQEASYLWAHRSVGTVGACGSDFTRGGGWPVI